MEFNPGIIWLLNRYLNKNVEAFDKFLIKFYQCLFRALSARIHSANNLSKSAKVFKSSSIYISISEALGLGSILLIPQITVA